MRLIEPLRSENVVRLSTKKSTPFHENVLRFTSLLLYFKNAADVIEKNHFHIHIFLAIRNLRLANVLFTSLFNVDYIALLIGTKIVIFIAST